MRSPVVRFVLGLGVLGLLVGCDSNATVRTDIPPAQWSREVVAVPAGESAFDAARFAVSQWFAIDQAQSQDGLITTFPTEFDERGGTGRVRDAAIRYPNRMRRKAIVRVSQTGDQASVDCVVIRERLDTSDYRVFAMNRQFDDVNNQTPIQGDAATSARQNEVWTEVGRDRGLERQILNVVREKLSAPTSPAPSPSAAEPAAAPADAQPAP